MTDEPKPTPAVEPKPTVVRNTPNIPPGLADEFVSLAQLKLINNREIVQLATVEPATARLRLESHARPQPIIRPVCHCKPDLLVFCAMNYAPGELVTAQVLAENNNPTVFFAFTITPELHSALNPQAQAQQNILNRQNLPQGPAGEVAFALAPVLNDIANTNKAILQRLEQQGGGNSEDIQAARDMVKASVRAMAAKFDQWAKDAEDPGAAAVKQIQRSTELITVMHGAQQTSMTEIMKLYPQAASTPDEWKTIERLYGMATSPQAQRAFMGFLYMLGAKNMGFPGQDAQPGPPNQSPKGTFQAETVKQ